MNATPQRYKLFICFSIPEPLSLFAHVEILKMAIAIIKCVIEIR